MKNKHLFEKIKLKLFRNTIILLAMYSNFRKSWLMYVRIKFIKTFYRILFMTFWGKYNYVFYEYKRFSDTFIIIS